MFDKRNVQIKGEMVLNNELSTNELNLQIFNKLIINIELFPCFLHKYDQYIPTCVQTILLVEIYSPCLFSNQVNKPVFFQLR